MTTHHGDTMTTMCGTPEYVAPEILFSSKNSNTQADGYGVEVDMWSAGALLYILLSGTLAFQQENKVLLYDSIRKGNFSFTPEERWSNVSEGAKDLIKKLITVDPQQRLTVDQALAHHWFDNEKEVNTELDIQDALQFTMSQGSLSYNVLDFDEVVLDNSEEDDEANRTPHPFGEDVNSPELTEVASMLEKREIDVAQETPGNKRPRIN